MHRKDMIQMIAVIAALVVAFFLAQAYLFPEPKPKPVPNTEGNAPADNSPPSNTETPSISDDTPSRPAASKPTAADEARGFRLVPREKAAIHALANEHLTAYFSDCGAVLERLIYVRADGESVYQPPEYEGRMAGQTVFAEPGDRTIYYHTPDNPIDEPQRPLEFLRPLDEAPELVPMALVLDRNDSWRNSSRWERVADAPASELGVSVTYRFPPSRGFEFDRESDGTVIYKTFTLLPDTYRIDVTLRIENKGQAGLEKIAGLWGPVGVTNDAARNSAEHTRISLWASTDSKRFVQFEDAPGVAAIKGDIEDIHEDMVDDGLEPDEWVDARMLDEIDEDDRFLVVHGIRTQYFLAFLAADPDHRDRRWSGHIMAIKNNSQHAAVSLIAPKMEIAAGESSEVHMRLYAGPREKDQLEKAWLANPPRDTELKIQWNDLATSGFFDAIAAPLIWVLGLLTNAVGAGFAIVLLTLMVRFALSPLSYRGQKSMATYTQKMKVVKPKLDAIKEKYAGRKDQASQLKMLTETREAMKAQNVGMLPLGGCLPMLIQLPIFIGLYRAFGAAFFLRQESFLWIHDLSLPDATIPVSTYLGDGWLSFLAHNGWLTFNLLPILWIILSVLQFKLQPKPDDPQQAAMQKNMAIIFPIMGLMFYGFAAGFSFYFIISSLYSIAESKLVKRSLVKQGVVPDPRLKPKVDEKTKPDYHAS